MTHFKDGRHVNMKGGILSQRFVVFLVRGRISRYSPGMLIKTVWSSITRADHWTWHLSCHAPTPPSRTWADDGASTLDQMQNGERCSRDTCCKCDWIQCCAIFACMRSILDRIQDRRVWLSGWLPYYRLMMSTMHVLNKGSVCWR